MDSPELEEVDHNAEYTAGDTYSYLSTSSMTTVTWTRDDQGGWRCDDGRTMIATDDDVRKAQADDGSGAADV